MNPPEHPSAPEPASMRASDSDRDKVADRLREALAEGRITPEEHAERIDVVYAAKTYAELEPVLRDLPGEQAESTVRLTKDTAEPAPATQGSHIIAIFAGASRSGRWLVEPETNVTCVFGGTELDFRRAVLSQREVTVNVTCIFGGVEITVPPGVRVVNSNSAVFGGVDVPEDDDLSGEAPVIRLTGFTMFGGVNVRRRAVGEKHRRDRRAAARELHQEIHEQHREMRDEQRDRLRELRDARRHDRRHGH
ncbi:DUF1707 domain-containing protein [Spirillospora sp. NPDC047279]|uniref:DUF1707 SHOCT-like domain-containing protein n=1 Tax=Spirillospora sp. NPDC047279 TaxID=3155478 RepID=UPI0033FBEC77